MSVLSRPVESPASSIAPPHLDPLVARYLDLALHPGAVPAEAAEVRMRGIVRVGPAWLPFRAVETVAPCAGYLLRARVLGVMRLVEEQRGGDVMCRESLGRLAEEDDSLDAVRHARTHRALAALWVPGALRPETGASWGRVDGTHLRLTVADLDLTAHVHPHGHLLGVRTLGWGDPHRTGHPRWLPIGYKVRQWRTFGSVSIPAAVAVGWFPGTSHEREIARLQLTSWRPRPADAFR